MDTVADSDLAAVRLAAAAFGVPDDAELVFVKQRENIVFRVRAAGLDRSLRLHRAGYRSDRELSSEVAALDAYRSHGIRVPAPVRTPSGEHVVTVDTGAGPPRLATMQTWIDGGTMLGDSDDVFRGGSRPSADGFRELGAVAAQLHAAGAPPAGYERSAWDGAGLAGPDPLWGDPARLRSLEAADRAVIEGALHRIAATLAHAGTAPDVFGVIHADLTFENVLTTAEGLAVIDFDDSGAGWYLFDLATPFFWCTPHPDATGILADLVAGYRSVRPLDPDPDVWHALLLARGLSYLGWAADRVGDPTSDFIERDVAPWVVAAARHYVGAGDTGWPTPPREGTA